MSPLRFNEVSVTPNSCQQVRLPGLCNAGIWHHLEVSCLKHANHKRLKFDSSPVSIRFSFQPIELFDQR